MKSIGNIKVVFDNKYLKELMIINNISQGKLAHMIGSDRPLVNRWINGIHQPSNEMLYKIALVLDVPMEDLLKEI